MIPLSFQSHDSIAISVTWLHCHFSHMTPLPFQSHDSIVISVTWLHCRFSHMSPFSFQSHYFFVISVTWFHLLLCIPMSHGQQCGSWSACFYTVFLKWKSGTSRTWNNLISVHALIRAHFLLYGLFNYFLASSDLGHLMITFANTLDPNQAVLIWTETVQHSDSVPERTLWKNQQTTTKAYKITQHAKTSDLQWNWWWKNVWTWSPVFTSSQLIWMYSLFKRGYCKHS